MYTKPFGKFWSYNFYVKSCLLLLVVLKQIQLVKKVIIMTFTINYLYDLTYYTNDN